MSRKHSKGFSNAFGSDENSSSADSITINKNYAKSYDERKKKEEYRRSKILKHSFILYFSNVNVI